MSAASVGYHFATAHDLRDGVFRSAGERIRTAILAILLASDTSLPLAELYGRAARALVTEESPAIVTVFEMMLESRHEAALAEAAASLTNRLVRHLEATAGPGIDGALIAACLQGLVLASLSLPIESRGPWLEQATVALLQRCA